MKSLFSKKNVQLYDSLLKQRGACKIFTNKCETFLARFISFDCTFRDKIVIRVNETYLCVLHTHTRARTKNDETKLINEFSVLLQDTSFSTSCEDLIFVSNSLYHFVYHFRLPAVSFFVQRET